MWLWKDLVSSLRQKPGQKRLIKSLSNIKQIMPRKLAAFDFDHTVINDNTDTAVITFIDKSKIPKEIKALHKHDGWTAFMQGIFKLLHEHGIDEVAIKNLIENLPAIDGMPELFDYLNEASYDVIIISDSNSYFINSWLIKNKLDDKVLKVFTNPAEFVKGLLTIKMYHLQDSCKLSTKNLCKGQILEDFIREQNENGVIYDKVIYCGDGTNDFCPILRLSEGDLACIRDNYKCLDLVMKSQKGECINDEQQPRVLKAQVLIWNNAYDILEKIRSF